MFRPTMPFSRLLTLRRTIRAVILCGLLDMKSMIDCRLQSRSLQIPWRLFIIRYTSCRTRISTRSSHWYEIPDSQDSTRLRKNTILISSKVTVEHQKILVMSSRLLSMLHSLVISFIYELPLYSPLVRTNPVTGWKSLFGAAHQVEHGWIEGVTPRESEILKQYCKYFPRLSIVNMRKLEEGDWYEGLTSQSIDCRESRPPSAF